MTTEASGAYVDDALAAALLAEDYAGVDLTTETLALAGRRGRLTFSARVACVVAGLEIAERMLTLAGLAVARRRVSGDRTAPGEILLTGEGDAGALHAGWKSAQTLVEALSGVATAARAIVEAVEQVDRDVRVACTRKTFPGARRLSQIAVKAGGAILHRAGLSETILVFPEHLAFLSDAPLVEIAETLRRRAPEKRPAIEVGSVAAAEAAITAGFEIVQLEKFAPREVATVAAFAQQRRPVPLIAAAGGVNVGNAAEYVRAGAGLIVTSAPYSAAPCDVQVRIEAL